MLSMSNVTSVASAASYYAEDNYYSQDENQAMSEWAGKGSVALGLEGAVDPHEFAKVLSGDVGGEQLGRIIGKGPDGQLEREHRPGFDVTLSAPKSVSLMAEVEGKSEVRAAHEAAVSKVLAYIETHLVGARVTEAGETRFEKTGNVVAGRFHHTTSRELDPQTHTHLVIANATLTASGHWRSISNEMIYQNQKLLGSIYDTELAANLRGLGYNLDSTPDGRWEIAGISRQQIEHFSQRSQAIQERLEKFGLSRATATAAQREDAALKTRDSKKAVDHAALREDWKVRAKEQGIDFASIEAERQRGLENLSDPALGNEKASDAVLFAIRHLTERESVVAHNEVLQVALNHAIKDALSAGVRLDAVEGALEKAIAAKFALVTPDGALTTPESLARERSMLSMLEAGRASVQPILPAARIEESITSYQVEKAATIESEFRLTTGQEEAARVALGSNDQFIGMQGYAGTGKTTMLELVRSAAETAGFTVRGMAASAEAASNLQSESGIESVTTARFLLDEGRRAVQAAKPVSLTVSGAVDMKGDQIKSWTIDLPNSLKAGHGRAEVWVMDEASLAGQREVSTVMDMAQKAGARVLFVGDVLQLNAVGAGKPFEILQRAGIAGAEMTEINRQQVDDLKGAVAAAVRRDNAAALTLLSERIVEVPDKVQLYERIANDILAKHSAGRSDMLLMVPLNSDRHAINEQVRAGLQARGDIGTTAVERTILVSTGFTDAQKHHAAYYQPDMIVRFGRDYSSLGVERGDYATVVDVKREVGVVLLEASEGRQFEWNPEKHGKVEVYGQESRAIGLGDEIRFTRNNTDLGAKNGTFGRVTEINGTEIVLQTKTGPAKLAPDAMAHAHWDYGYSMTFHAAQGATTSHANLLITHDSGRAMGEKSFYVGITRPRQDLTIYTDSAVTAAKLIQTAQNKTSSIDEMRGSSAHGDSRVDDDVATTAARGSSGAGRSEGAER